MWSHAKKAVGQFLSINWEALIGGRTCWLAMLVEQSGSQFVANDPMVALLQMLTGLSSCFIAAVVPNSSVTVFRFPSPQWFFQFSSSVSDHVDQSLSCFLLD